MSRIHHAIRRVTRLPSLDPNDEVNAAFEALVNAVVDLSNDTVDPHTEETIRRICADAETKMEYYWAKLIGKSREPIRMLETFPYNNNYRELVGREVALAEKNGLMKTHGQRVLVVGSGPLPLTAVNLTGHGFIVDQIDRSPEAVRHAERMQRAIGQKGGEYIVGDAQGVQLNHMYHLIIVAALAGNDQHEKQMIIDALLPYLHADGRLLLRSAIGARALLYPRLEATAFSGVELLDAYHPSDRVINSVLVYKKDTHV